MLTAIREKATGWIAWVIAILITVPMALWGINSYFEGASEIAVATVNDEEIPVYTYQQDLRQQSQILSQRLGSGFDPEMLETQGIRDDVLDQLINNQLLTQYTTGENFRVTDSQLQKLLVSHPSFQVDGKFDLEQYEAILRSNGFSPQSFEQYQRVTEANRQLFVGIAESGFITTEEQTRIVALQTQRRVAQYVVISPQIASEIEVSAEEIEAYYEKNQDRFNTEERIKVDYIDLSVDSLVETIQPSEAEIEAHYEESKEKYKTAESRKARHILIAADADLSAEERQDKKDSAQGLLIRAQAGEDFADLAKEFSEDPGSGKNGGDLGVINRGQMVKPFEDTVFSMEEGDIEGLVETQFGFHIINLTEFRESSQKPLDEVMAQVVDELSRIQGEDLFADLAESFKNLVFESPDTINGAADALDLEVQQSDWFTINSGAGIATESAVRRAAFEQDVKQDGFVSSAIEIGFEQLVAVQKIDFEPVILQSLESVKEEVEQIIFAEKAQDEVVKRGSEMLTELQQQPLTHTQWQNRIEEKNLEIKDLPLSKDEYESALIALAQAVFSSPRPDSEKVSSGGVLLANGEYAIYSIQEIINGSIDDVDESVKTNIDATALAREGAEVFAEFLIMLRDAADVVIFEEQL